MANKKLITGVILSIFGIVFVSHGNTMNNGVMANFSRAMGLTQSLGKAGFLDKYPGAIWIIVGTVMAIIGGLLLFYHFSGKKLPIDSLLKLLQPKISNLPDSLRKPLQELLEKLPNLTDEGIVASDNANEGQIKPLENEDLTEISEEIIATPSTQRFWVNGEEKTDKITAYSIKNKNYVKLRDLADLMTDTASKFNVEWKEEKEEISLTIGKNYKHVAESPTLLGPAKGDSKAKEKYGKLIVNEKQTENSYLHYEINDNNYFGLAELAIQIQYDKNPKGIIDMEVIYIEQLNTVVINSPDFETARIPEDDWISISSFNHNNRQYIQREEIKFEGKTPKNYEIAFVELYRSNEKVPCYKSIATTFPCIITGGISGYMHVIDSKTSLKLYPGVYRVVVYAIKQSNGQKKSNYIDDMVITPYLSMNSEDYDNRTIKNNGYVAINGSYGDGLIISAKMTGANNKSYKLKTFKCSGNDYWLNTGELSNAGKYTITVEAEFEGHVVNYAQCKFTVEEPYKPDKVETPFDQLNLRTVWLINNEYAAFMNAGHNAIFIVADNGRSAYFSYHPESTVSLSNANTPVPGTVSCKYMSASETSAFLQHGNITGNVDEQRYTRGIKFTVSAPDGKLIYDRAYYWFSNPGLYYAIPFTKDNRQCDVVASDIMSAAKLGYYVNQVSPNISFQGVADDWGMTITKFQGTFDTIVPPNIG